MSAFKLDPGADASGTSRRGEITVPPKRLVDIFGPPGDGDGDKVSGEYVFTDGAGNVFTVYDWKATSLFDDGLAEGEESALPRSSGPTETRTGSTSGAGGDLEAFKRWLAGQTDESPASTDRGGL